MTDTEIIEAIGQYNLTVMPKHDIILISWVQCYGKVRDYQWHKVNRGLDDANTIRNAVRHVVESIKAFKPPEGAV